MEFFFPDLCRNRRYFDIFRRNRRYFGILREYMTLYRPFLIIFLFWPVFWDILSIFLPIFAKMGLFPKKRFGPIWSPYFGLTSCRKSAKTNEKISQKSWKTLILGYFDHIYCHAHFLRIFSKNRALSPFYIYDPLTSCKKAKKSNEPIRLTRNGRTN